jgi:hypothetical protein
MIVYIASMPHSGSTLLDICLGCHDNLVSMGEVWSGIQKIDWERQNVCTCGKAVGHCPVWAHVWALFQRYDHTPVLEETAYRMVPSVISNLYGPGKAIVDSSKYMEPLEKLVDRPGLKVLFLKREVEGYVNSMRKKNRGIIRGNPVYLARQWSDGNRKFAELIRQRGLDAMPVNYGHLCAEPAKTLKNICDFLGISYSEKMTVPANNTNSHMIRGNRLMRSPEKLKTIRYDESWSRHSVVSWLALSVSNYFEKRQQKQAETLPDENL